MGTDFRLGVGISSDILSAHNRSVACSRRILSRESRVGNGALVRDVIGVKREWDFEFKQLPHSSIKTIDGGMGVEALRSLFDDIATGTLTLVCPEQEAADSVHSVLFKADSYEEVLRSRRATANWKSDVKFSLVELGTGAVGAIYVPSLPPGGGNGGGYTGTGLVGGGVGYTNIITNAMADYVVETKAELLYALSVASPGDIIFVPSWIAIDMTGTGSPVISEGVIIASDRGYDGSLGGLLYVTGTSSSTMFHPESHVKFNGLRLQGPTTGITYAESVSLWISGIWFDGYHALEVENCEISGFSFAGVYVKDDGCSGLTDSDVSLVHHCYIHHCQRAGIGYGVCVESASVLAEYNIYDYCRHYIAGSRSEAAVPPTNFHAQYNLCRTKVYSSMFDCHGGNDGGYVDVTTSAGGTIIINRNTFMGPSYHGDSGHTDWEMSVGIRGVPRTLASVVDNWSYAPTLWPVGTPADYIYYQGLDNLIGEYVDGKPITGKEYVHMEAYNNHYGTMPPDGWET